MTSKTNEDMIRGFLGSMGLQGQFEDRPSGIRQAVVEHMGVRVRVQITPDPEVVRIYMPFAFLNPRTAGPLMRRLLGMNSELASGCYFGMVESQETLVFTAARLLEGLGRAEFVGLCDGVAGGYWQFCTNLMQEFQLDTQAR